MYRIAVVEDEPVFADTLKGFLVSFEEESGVCFDTAIFRDGEDIVEAYHAQFDIILMDIQMRFMNGIDAAKEIRERDPAVLIMFITNAAEFAIKGYEVRAFDYLLKPLSYTVFSAKLRLALDSLPEKKENTLLLTVADGVRRISIRRILYVESQGHTMYIVTKDGTETVHVKMSDLEKELAPYHFFRCNKGYLVNMDAVESVDSSDCIVAGHRVPISRRKRAEFMDYLTAII